MISNVNVIVMIIKFLSLSLYLAVYAEPRFNGHGAPVFCSHHLYRPPRRRHRLHVRETVVTSPAPLYLPAANGDFFGCDVATTAVSRRSFILLPTLLRVLHAHTLREKSFADTTFISRKGGWARLGKQQHRWGSKKKFLATYQPPLPMQNMFFLLHFCWSWSCSSISSSSIVALAHFFFIFSRLPAPFQSHCSYSLGAVHKRQQ